MCPKAAGIASVAAVAVITAAAAGVGNPAREASLAVRDLSGWTTWWRSSAAPSTWDDDAPLGRHVAWHPGAAGIEWGEVQLRGSSEAWRTRLIIVRVDPGKLEFSLVPAFTQNASWTIANADTSSVLAFDAGQFRGSLPYGWVVTRGEELLAPEYAPLAGAVVLDSSGAVRIVKPDSVAAERQRGNALEAFQSFPVLLMDGTVPAPLRNPGAGVDLSHRDARLAIGTLEDGRMLIALTRFDALGPSLGRVPFGLTTPEMAAVMGALGSRQAIMLDGGISGQLMLRQPDGTVRSWQGTRRVPLGLTAKSRQAP
jgi:hypothetical protein